MGYDIKWGFVNGYGFSDVLAGHPGGVPGESPWLPPGPGVVPTTRWTRELLVGLKFNSGSGRPDRRRRNSVSQASPPAAGSLEDGPGRGRLRVKPEFSKRRTVLLVRDGNTGGTTRTPFRIWIPVPVCIFWWFVIYQVYDKYIFSENFMLACT